MLVKLIGKTQGQGEFEGVSIDEMIVGQARVSTPKKDQELFDKPQGLIRFCALNLHWSIFDMADLTFEIHTSRAIGRQLLRHWTIKPQEFSQRYSNVVSFEPLDIRMKGSTNRQGSLSEVVAHVDVNNRTSYGDASISNAVIDALETSKESYDNLLAMGVANESARMILPEVTTTKLYMKGSVRSWITFLSARLTSHTQKEARDIAEAIKEIFIKECPMIAEAFYNFETHDPEMSVLDRIVLEKYKMYNKL